MMPPPTYIATGREPPAGGLPGVAAIVLLLVAAVAVPVMTHPMPPLSDYINNLARAYVIATIDADADLQRYYAIEWRIIPNLVMDLVVPVLYRVMTIYVAGQVFTVTALALILGGTFALHRALFGRWSVVPALAAVILYNEVMLVGVMNYVFGLGLALWALAGWIALRSRRSRFVASAAFVAALFVCHLYTVGLYGLGVLAFETQRLWRHSHEAPLPRLVDFVASGMPFLVAAALLAASPTMGLIDELSWELPGKLQGLLFVIRVYDDGVAAGLLVAVALALGLAVQRGLVRLHPAGVALVIIGGAVYLAMPRLLFGTHMADQRLPVALAFMLIAATDVDLRQRRVRLGFAALVIALLAVRLAEVQIVWDRLSHQTAHVLDAVLTMERGARVLTVHADRDAYAKQTVSDFNLVHAASLATIERSALVSGAFIVGGKHVLQVRKPFHRYVNRTDRTPPEADWLALAAGPVDETDRFYWSHWHLHYDYVLVMFTPPGRASPDPARLQRVREGPGFQLYRVIAPT